MELIGKTPINPLGTSVRLGLPTGETKLKNRGIHKVSRNPMYLGFDLLTISSIVGNANLLVLVLGIDSIITYDLIIRAEEKFLKERFGEHYQEYKERVNRYIGWRRGK
jgi:protein-S-isoprenylcysteine O-methyltransferase Ste14